VLLGILLICFLRPGPDSARVDLVCRRVCSELCVSYINNTEILSQFASQKVSACAADATLRSSLFTRVSCVTRRAAQCWQPGPNENHPPLNWWPGLVWMWLGAESARFPESFVVCSVRCCLISTPSPGPQRRYPACLCRAPCLRLRPAPQLPTLKRPYRR
jgi:hypothetical protein